MLHPTLKPSHAGDGASHPAAQWQFHFVRIDSCGDSSGFPPDSLLSLRGTLLRVYETIRIWTIFILKQGLTFDNYEFMVADGRLSAALSPRRLSFLHHVSRGIQHPFIVFNARNLSRHITHHQQRVR